MKGYRSFIIVFSGLFILYVIAEINKPKPIDWTVTISRSDKNPYGGYIIYNQLKNIFPAAIIQTFHASVFKKEINLQDTPTAYLVIGSALRPGASIIKKMKNYVSKGNYVLVSANQFNTPFLNSFGVETTTPVSFKPKDSTSINFVNSSLKDVDNYTFLQGTIDQYFSKIDNARATILSINNHDKPVFLKVPYGKGAFFIHAAPICFSNYFLLFRNNATYTSKALSYIPKNVSKIYWDEYYKSGPKREVPTTPFRFFLSNEYLAWALRLSLTGLLLYVFFEMKRRQRPIPVITPFKNSTLDFVKTVAAVYYNEKDNNGIAYQKVNYFLENVRNRFNIATQTLNEEFAEQLHRKSGVAMEETSDLVRLLVSAQTEPEITDEMLLDLDGRIDNFYKQVL